MSDFDPWVVVAFIVASFAALTVGVSLSKARGKAVGQLMSVCAGTESEIGAAMACGTGLLTWWVIPGIIGVFLIVIFSIIRDA